MNRWHTFTALLGKELMLEYRQRYAIWGILLYVCSMVFVVYVAAVKIQPPMWNVLFWLIFLFAAINAVVKSFVQESGSRQLYHYQIAEPEMVLVSKMVYNAILLLVLGGLALLVFSVVAGHPVRHAGLFAGTLLLGSVGFSIALTFISAISAGAHNSATLMAVLSFPVLLPMLMTLIRLSAISLALMQDTSYWRDILNLLAIDAILITLTFVLFPYVWRD